MIARPESKAKLTKALVERILPRDRDVILWDTDVKGFGVKVTPRGRRSYLLYYRTSSGQQRRPNIGPHGVFTPETARQQAQIWLREVAAGKDVSAERQADRKAETVSQLAARYLSDHAELHKKPSSIAADRAIMANHITPQIGQLKLKDVKRSDIERCMVAIRDGRTAATLPAYRKRGRRIVRGGAVIANRTIALLSKMFSCAVDWDLIQANPARGIKKFREARKDRFLDIKEIRRLLGALDAADRTRSESAFATAAIRFLLLTGMRSSEVTHLRWSEVDFSTSCLRLADTKTGPRVIPLSTHALQIIKALPRGNTNDLVFQSSQRGGPIALTRPWYRVRKASEIDATATIHTLRHTFASWSVMAGQSLSQVGAVLGHKSAQTTLRYADHRLDALRSYSEQTANLFVRGNRDRSLRRTAPNKRAMG